MPSTPHCMRAGQFSNTQLTLGARGDSYYEYLLKFWLQSGRKDTMSHDMYVDAVDGTIDRGGAPAVVRPRS